MPEGPEIRRQAERVARAVAGRVTTGVFFAFEHLKPWEEELTGRLIEAVEARGKAILTRFEGGVAIYSHNQLYGRWYVKPAGELAKTRRQLRLALHTEKRSALLYSASDIEVLRPEEIATHPFLAKLGPDVLDPEVTAKDIHVRLEDRRFARRNLGGLLLNQGFVAGLGNYLRTEILHEAGIHPGRRPVDLSATERRRLAEVILEISRRSYRTRGITNDPDRAAALKSQGLRRSRYRHAAFRRTGKSCYRCETPLERHTVAGRRLDLCPRCQPAPEKSSPRR